MSTALRDRIIAYLGQGIQQSIVATSCGVTPAYISQLLELEDVREEVAQIRAKHLDSALEVDSSIERIERAALKQVEQKLPFVRSAMEAAKIFATLNSAKKKTAGTDQNSDALAAQQVTVTLPRGAAIHFKLNESNQVIEVEGRTMAPLPSKALPALQARLRAPTDVQTILPVFSTPSAAQAETVEQRKAAQVEKQAAADTKRAHSILSDMTTYMNGVAVVL
ncbi:MAG: hypothetical protein WA130_08800 [Candidatus Methanoperedens sp.]